MAIDDIEPTDPMKPYKGTKQEKKGSKKEAPRFSLEGAIRSYERLTHSENDAATFMGIPENELTENVSKAIIFLREEIERLKTEISHLHSFETILANSADKHNDLLVLTRHALMREVRVFCSSLQRSQAEGVFVYLQIRNLPEIKNEYGLLCADEVKKDTAIILKNHLRKTDKIGTLGGDGFGILLSLSTLEQARIKMESIINRMTSTPMIWNGLAIDIAYLCGFHNLEGDDDSAVILAMADLDRRSKLND